MQFKRFRGKINIQRPRAPHYDRARVIAVTNPIYPEKQSERPCPDEKLIKMLKQKEDNPYEIVLAREVKNWFDRSPVIGFFQINPINADDYFKARVAFHKQNMQLKQYGKYILKRALNDTIFEAVLPVFETKTAMVFSSKGDTKSVSLMLKAVKKIPQMQLICGIAENRLLSKNEFVSYSEMPDLTTMRAQFASLLSQSSGSVIVQNLQSHQQQLVNILEAHVRENKKDAEPKS